MSQVDMNVVREWVKPEGNTLASYALSLAKLLAMYIALEHPEARYRPSILSKHVVTKDIREALDAVQNKLIQRREIDLLVAKYSPFKYPELNRMFRETLKGLLEKYIEYSETLSPQLAMKLKNLIIDAVYNYVKDIMPEVNEILQKFFSPKTK